MTNFDKSDNKKVLQANFGSKLSFQIALALQEADLLESFATSFYYRQSSICSLLSKLSSNLDREFSRRYIRGLDESLVSDRPYTELIGILARRAPLPSSLAAALSKWREARIKNFLKNEIINKSPRAVITCDGWALNSFDACEQIGALKILDQNTAHVTKAAQIMKEERELHPEFADTLSGYTDLVVQRGLEEIQRADAIILSSDYAKKSIVELGVDEQKISIVQYGADISRFCPAMKDPSTPFRILFVGNIGQGKGIKYLLEAYKKLNLPNASLHLVGHIAGTGDGLTPYRDLFTHTPNVPYEEMTAHFQAADLFVLPSLHESGVLSIHEALASGVPVITTPNAGSIVEEGKQGFVVPIRDVDAIAEKIELLHRDRELHQQMSKNARTRAEQFTWEVYRKRFGETVRGII